MFSINSFQNFIQGGFFMRQKVYTFKEFAQMRNKCIVVNNHILTEEMIIKALSVVIPMFLMSVEMCYAAPSTGMSALDKGGWKLVTVFQSAIFWMSMIYSLKSLLEFLAKGEGNMKKIMTGASACAGAYLIPWLFTIIRDSFK
jgi:hypothetical protein